MISIPGRIPIRIFPFFWVLITVIGWLNTASIMGTALWIVIITISILVHEFGHALTALAFGQQAEIDLVGLGGLTRRSGAAIRKWQEFFVVLNGPCAGFLLFALSYQLLSFINAERFPTWTYILEVFMYVNLYWNILNLLPVIPLDGGHLMRVALEGFFGFKGLKISLMLSLILAGLLSLLFFVVQYLFAAILFLMLAFESYRAWYDLKPLTQQDSDLELRQLFQEAQDDIKAGHQHEALSKLIHLREQTKEGLLFVAATQLYARLLAEQGQWKEACEVLAPLENQISPDFLRLLQQLAYRLQNWKQAVRVGANLYQKEPQTDVALFNALAHANMGEAKPAVGWLRSAIQLGLPQASQILKRHEFDAIRETPEFQSLANKLS